MRRIAIINQKGGVGKTTTAVNLGAALARAGKRVVVVDLDPQANASLHLGQELLADEPSTYGVLCHGVPFEDAMRPTSTPGLSIVPAHIDLSGAELELAAAIGRETILRDAVSAWVGDEAKADYLLFDCPPSLGLLSVNGLAAAEEVVVVLQTEFFALQGLSKLIEVVHLLRTRLNPDLRIAGVLPCLYDSRLRLAREVLAEIRRHFGDQVFSTPIRANVKLAEAPSHGLTIFEYDANSAGAKDFAGLAAELIRQEITPGNLTAEPEADEVKELERRVVSLSREQAQEDEPAAQAETPPPAPVSASAPDSAPKPAPEPTAERAPEPAAGEEPAGGPFESVPEEPVNGAFEEEPAAEATPSTEAPSAETRAAETQAAETQAAETQAAETQAAETQAAGTPAAGTPAVEPELREVDVPRPAFGTGVAGQGTSDEGALPAVEDAGTDGSVTNGSVTEDAAVEPPAVEPLMDSPPDEAFSAGLTQEEVTALTSGASPVDAPPATEEPATPNAEPVEAENRTVATLEVETRETEEAAVAPEPEVEEVPSAETPTNEAAPQPAEEPEADQDPAPPAPTGALRPRHQGDYIGEDNGPVGSIRGPWSGRS